MKTLLKTFLCLLLSTAIAKADGLKGHVYDQKTGEPLVGVTVILEQTKLVALTGLDGSFEFKKVTPGQFTLVISHLTYKTLTKQVTVTEKDNPHIAIYLSDRNSKSLSEVVVSANTKGSTEKTARKLEQQSVQIMNVVSGAAIEVSPDLTVANVIQRVSGVSIERSSNGDGQYAILRGMDKRYNYTLINGVKIPSPDNKYRYVPLDLFPSELLERLEVYKTLTPNMEGDAIGGVVNMVMKDAPNKLSVNANIATGYSQILLDKGYTGFDAGGIRGKSPYEINGKNYKATPADFATGTLNYQPKNFAPNVVAGLSVGQRFFDNKLGVILAGSFQNNYRGTTSTFYNAAAVETDKIQVITGMENRQYSEQQKRGGLHGKVDYAFNDDNKVSLYTSYMNLQSYQTRSGITTNISNAEFDPAAGNAQITFKDRSRKINQRIFNSTLHGEHKLIPGRLKLQWSAVASSAQNEVPDNTTISIDGVRKNFQETRNTIDQATRRWERNTDNDIAGYADLTYTAKIAGTKVDFSAGGLYRDKQRSSFVNNYVFKPLNVNDVYGKDFNSYTDIKWELQNPTGSVDNALTYDASEKTAAGYGMFKFKASSLEVTGGVRVEHTNQGYHMLFPKGEPRPNGNQVYTDVLPSLTLKYELAKHQNLHASYFRSLNRPGFFELVPGPIVQEEYTEVGNPDLKRAIADNLDLRYELFPNHTDQLLVGVFYKSIKDPIENTIVPGGIRGQDQFYMPGNFGTARNYGLELDYIKFFHNIGFKANYTYTNSSITTTKSYRYRDDKGDIHTGATQQTRPLYGQSAHIANLSVLYKDTQHGWDAQLAGSYTGPRINVVSQFVDNDFWQKGFIQMDISVEKRFGNNFSIFAKAGNLLNTPAEIFIKGANDKNAAIPGQGKTNETLIRKEYYKQTYLLGVRYKL
ncbi:TonB-dependent receptor domain-containing protein [Chitinophaga sp. 22321]|uniref:TonB-dependent receptor n=1 Tax=Chitinophaga hostae TaxID=2831022 RepID=A0ABS5J840_9BACT|nr:TonB-dependent receptor [Chitinophaga hostae]MBS0031240.1 TonB-dependent receptor [Chitinophaga hostae]